MGNSEKILEFEKGRESEKEFSHKLRMPVDTKFSQCSKYDKLYAYLQANSSWNKNAGEKHRYVSKKEHSLRRISEATGLSRTSIKSGIAEYHGMGAITFSKDDDYYLLPQYGEYYHNLPWSTVKEFSKGLKPRVMSVYLAFIWKFERVKWHKENGRKIDYEYLNRSYLCEALGLEPCKKNRDAIDLFIGILAGLELITVRKEVVKTRYGKGEEVRYYPLGYSYTMVNKIIE